MIASGEPITKCPVCRYDLTGLPRNHTCPECGFEYNEHMKVWHLKDPTFIPPRTPGIFLLLFSLVAMVVKFTSSPFAARFALVYAVLVGGCSFYLLYLLFLALRSSAFIVVEQDKLLYRFALGPIRYVDWGNLMYIDSGMRPRILINGKPKLLLLPISFMRRGKRDTLLHAIRDQWAAKQANSAK